jgi:hypothetical protein
MPMCVLCCAVLCCLIRSALHKALYQGSLAVAALLLLHDAALDVTDVKVSWAASLAWSGWCGSSDT